MTFHLAYRDDSALLVSSRAVIKRSERRDFENAMDLLADIARLRADAESVVAAARAEGHAAGLAEARDAALALIADRLAAMADAIERHAAERREEIAAAAYAAARAIVGTFEPDEAMARVIEQTLSRLGDDRQITVEVAPALHTAIGGRFGGHSHVSLIANEALADTDCRIVTPEGRILAGLDVQFESLATRWGVTP